MSVQLHRWFSLSLLLAPVACRATAGQGSGTADTLAAVATTRDPHGELLHLLPPDAAAWSSFDAARARASRNWPAVTALLTTNGITEQLSRFESSTGLNLLNATKLAVGVYQAATSPDERWNVIIAQGGVSEQSVRSMWRQSQLVPRVEQVGRISLNHISTENAVVFLADDVVVAMSAPMAARMARQFSGEERAVVNDNPTFAPLWQQAGVQPTGLFLAAGEAASAGPFMVRRREDGLPSVTQFVLRAELTADEQLTVRCVGKARDVQAATALASELEGIRRDYADRFVVRLMGFGRLLNQGITAVSDGPYVRVSADTANDEIPRIIRAVQTAEAFGQ